MAVMGIDPASSGITAQPWSLDFNHNNHFAGSGLRRSNRVCHK